MTPRMGTAIIGAKQDTREVHQMSEAFEFVKDLFRNQLQLGDRADELTRDSAVVGAIPEFDSVAVVSLITAIEEQLGVEIDDDEITGELFATVGSLTDFVEQKMG